jgi:exopolyphosphatase/guanosine-5'-triphosphate,3'-diphosphate pyrophosphatase
MTKFRLNKKHAQHICQLTQSLFDQLTGLHQIPDPGIPRLIKTAALLHDCGTQIRYYNHHEHSFYILLNSAINGLTHRELLMSAYIAASHRKDPAVHFARYDLLLTKEDHLIIQKVGVLLRIAESLDRGMTGIVQEVHCEILGDTVIIQTVTAEDPELAIYNAMTAGKQFQKIYGKRLQIV